MSHSISCPHCNATLKSAAPVPAGKRVKCPKCAQMFTTGSAPAKPAAPAPPPSPSLDDDDEMAAAIAKLEAEQSLGKAPAPAAPKPAPAPAAPLPNMQIDDDDDGMAAAIAKLEAEQSLGKKPAPPPAPVVAAAPQVTAAPEEEIPEVDTQEDIPEMDSEEVADEPPAKVVKAAGDAKVSEKPLSPKRPRDDEDDDDDETGAKRSRKKSDPDDEGIKEKSSTRKPRSRDEDDDDEDDDRDSRKKRRDRDEEPNRGSKSKKAKTPGGPLMIGLLIGGGLIVLLGCCGIAAIGYFFLGIGGPSVLGKWEGESDPLFKLKVTIEFRRGGAGLMEIDGLAKMHFTYSQRGDEVTADVTEVEAWNGMKQQPNGDEARLQWKVRHEGNSLHLTKVGGKGGGASMTLKRVR